MKLIEFHVQSYRNILDSAWVRVDQLTALVGQNEAGKSNLCEALYLLNPFGNAKYNIHEDWPMDRWGEQDPSTVPCEARFELCADDIADLWEQTKPDADIPEKLRIRFGKSYDDKPGIILEHESSYETSPLGNDPSLCKWMLAKMPKMVYIHNYELSGSQIELDQLAACRAKPWNDLSNEEQTLLIITDLAKINIDDLVTKGTHATGRTLRTFDTKQASAYLSRQFAKLWGQKDVTFTISVDGNTLNIFVEDQGLGMPVRLKRRSTGFRWYVSFAWKFTHASQGQYKNCVILLEEPGIHLHHAGHQDLLNLFEGLVGGGGNTIIYTTHLATMIDPAFPERIRIVEVKDHHTTVLNGLVSSQRRPMMVIEACLGLGGGMSGLLGNRQTLIVEGGDDLVILEKLSGLLNREDQSGLSDRIFPFPAKGAAQTPMYAGFLVGHKLDAAVLLDSDGAGNEAKAKIKDLYLKDAATESRFRVLQIREAAGIAKTDAAIEDLFPDNFYLDCVNVAYRIAIKLEDLPQDGSTMITKRVEQVLKSRFGHKELDKERVLQELMKRFNDWKTIGDLPEGTAERAKKLFKTINSAFDHPLGSSI